MNWRQDVRRSSRTAAIKFEFNREERKRERREGGKGQRLVLVWSGPVTHYQPLEKPSQAMPSRDRHRDRGRHSTLGVFSASCQPRQRIRREWSDGRTDRRTDRRTVRLASDCDSDISMSPCLHPHPLASSLPILHSPSPIPLSHLSSRVPYPVYCFPSLCCLICFQFLFAVLQPKATTKLKLP